jgi:hypothetical protein
MISDRGRVTTFIAKGLADKLAAAYNAWQVDGVLAVTGTGP